MLLVILLWILIVVLLVVFVLRQARRDSHATDFFYTMQNEGESEPRKPRVVSTHIAYTPAGNARPGTAPEERDSTSETPVYVNDSSVVEVHALRDGENGGTADEAGRSSAGGGSEDGVEVVEAQLVDDDEGTRQ